MTNQKETMKNNFLSYIIPSTAKSQNRKAQKLTLAWQKLTLIVCVSLFFMEANANKIIDVDHVGIQVRLGYNIGGTSPLPLPSTIRRLDNYTFQPNLNFGFDVTHDVAEQVGVLFGIHFENKGMNVDAEVKNYHQELVRGGESLAGQFTGHVTTKVQSWMLTVPVQATYNLNEKVALRFGPYISLLIDKCFKGYAHNGYLRQGNPTGPKVILGDTNDARGDFDFSSNMRDLQLGLDLGADWYVYKRWGVYADITWGLSGIHEKAFKTIEQPLYPIYGTLGVTYNIKYKK
jgi:hypothetical protein